MFGEDKYFLCFKPKTNRFGMKYEIWKDIFVLMYVLVNGLHLYNAFTDRMATKAL